MKKKKKEYQANIMICHLFRCITSKHILQLIEQTHSQLVDIFRLLR